MDNLLRQMRSKYPGEQEYREEQGNIRRRTSSQKSQFREKNTSGSWLGRQFSRQMSRGNEHSDDGIERATAVAAAVYAICSVEESQIRKPKKKVVIVDRPETSSFPRFKEDTRASSPPRPPPEPVKVSRPFSDDKEFLRDGEEGSDRKMAVFTEPENQKPTENLTNSYDVPDMIAGDDRITEPQKPLTIPVPRPPTPPISRKPSTGPAHTTKPGPTQTQTRPFDPIETKADIWEKAEMAKIKHRYQKVNETISYWENKKREKAMRKLEESQAVGVKRSKREKGRKKFEEDMEFIKQIAGEARSKADEKRRNDILKANRKADIIRKTGDLPVTCYCC